MTRTEQPWDRQIQTLLVFIVGFNVLPHVAEIPIWVTALTAFFMSWKTLFLYRGTPMPPRWLLWSISLLGGAGVFIDFGTIIGKEAASAMLVFLASAKLLETNRYRDAMLVVFTSYFLLMAFLLTDQSLGATVFMAVDIFLITSLMFQIHKRDRRSSVRSFRPAIRLLGTALPVWVLLFVLFPRFSTGLLNLRQANTTSVGFSDQLSPGEVERLIENDDVALRVRWLDRKISISPESLYWRGGILSYSQGLIWTANPAQPAPLEQIDSSQNSPALLPQTALQNSTNPSFAGKALNYEVWLEPTFRKWLFTLDYPQTVSLDSRTSKNQVLARPGLIYELKQSIQTAVVYNGSSTLTSPPQVLKEKDLTHYLQLPPSLDPKVRELALQLKAKANESFLLNLSAKNSSLPEQVSSVVLKWFDENNFRYTRSPGALREGSGEQQLTEFLFETRRGFCEHYAAAFATLMRAAGVPARVTIGFQGGKLNEIGNYLVVRNLDAHAWAEIWVSNPHSQDLGSWTRVDPTATIAPLRLQLGGAFNSLGQDLLQSGLSGDEIQRRLHGGLSSLLTRFDLAWDALQMHWNALILNYDFNTQLELLGKFLSLFGIENFSRAALILTLGLSLTTGIVLFVISLHLVLRSRAVKEDLLLATWKKFCRTLELRGVNRGETEGPLAFAKRAAAAHPASANEILKISDLFIELRYGNPSDDRRAVLKKEFHQSVRRFNIPSSSSETAS